VKRLGQGVLVFFGGLLIALAAWAELVHAQSAHQPAATSGLGEAKVGHHPADDDHIDDDNDPLRGCTQRRTVLTSVRRVLTGLAMVGVLTLAGCSASTTSSPTTTIHCPSGDAACGLYKPILSTTTSTAPPTSTTTTTIALAAPLALGTSTELSYTEGVGPEAQVVSGRFTITRVWLNATPVAAGSRTTLPELLKQNLHGGPTSLSWVGIDLAVTYTSAMPAALISPTGPGQPYLTFVVNGHGPLVNENAWSLLTLDAVTVSGCPYPFRNGLLTSGTSSGCVAIPVPSGVKVLTVGFDLQPTEGGPVQHVAQWNV
jgi:hypothetical protein